MKKRGRKESSATKTEEPEEGAPAKEGKKEGEPGSIVTYLFVILVFGVQYRYPHSDPPLRLLYLTINLELCWPQNNINKIFHIMVHQCIPPYI